MMEETQALEYAKILFLRTGYCKHSEEFRLTCQPLGTKVTITSCGVCGKIISRVYLD